MTDPVAQNLRDAADLLDEYGWLKGAYGNKGVGFCAMGAICETAPNLEIKNETLEILELAVDQTVPGWNDSFWQKAKKVKRTLRELAQDIDDVNAEYAKLSSETTTGKK